MKRAILTAALLAAAGPASGADRANQPLDPRASYVLVEVEKLQAATMKGVDAPGSLILAPYDEAGRDIAGGKAASRLVLLDKPLAKSKKGRQYLVALQPATWVVEGASGTASSLGSVTFKVEPGEIVDLGVIKPAVDWAKGEGPKSMAGGIMGAALFGSMRPKTVRPMRVEWRPRGQGDDLPAPASIAGRKVTPVAFTPGATFGNHLGGLVNRFGGRATRPGSGSAAEQRPAGAPSTP
jgi:hypothetical protein